MTLPLQVPYRIVKSAKARRGRLIIQEDHIRVVVPRFGSERQMLKFLQEKEAWALRALARNQNHRLPSPPWPPAESDLPFLFRGEWLPLVFEAKPARKAEVNITADSILIQGREKPAAQALERLMGECFKKLLEQEALDITHELAPVLKRRPRSFHFKRLKSRWGSCSRAGRINLNLALIHLPREVFRYIVIHELAHLRHMNHGAAYWELVERMCPDYRQHEKLLHREGKAVLSFYRSRQAL